MSTVFEHLRLTAALKKIQKEEAARRTTTKKKKNREDMLKKENVMFLMSLSTPPNRFANSIEICFSDDGISRLQIKQT